MRSTFSHALVKAALNDPKIVLLTGDHGYALFDDFCKAVPGQFINAGIAEQNMVGMAAGLAKAGFKPVVYGLSAFVPVRVLEQIKIDVCYENLPVVFIGDGAGLVYSSLGSSHQSTEDIAVLRAIPHMRILSPGDTFEMAYAMEHALAFQAPLYLRMGKSDLGDVHHAPITAQLGDLVPAHQGTPGQLALLATGSMVGRAMQLSQQLGNCPVWSAPSIKPINHSQVAALAREVAHLVVLEEHAEVGGLGGLVAEIVAGQAGQRAQVIRCGIMDRFSEKCGSYNYLITEHGLDVPALLTKIRLATGMVS
ncbi:transketolase family protein [Janthinobacterium sp. AD80]|uniref:transketolase family protein n=1 Tax=Janthinobacterium sp. AD80 TaxID=1528773 RepID=UPI000C8366B8|nr:transketolase C-terminal domain-containing protein [Janthinobacterium sp. AD80]PMQ16377.1 1-deoxy-D-xylulose-5-phosphate synthase [Janthinobacterium sp. AD80]